MIIEKGYTREQFIDLIERNTINEYNGVDFLYVVKYNDYLKQPLKKDMFVNELQEPVNYYSDSPDKEKSKLYQGNQMTIDYLAAEKKVIFKGWKKSTYHKYQVVFGCHIITFANADYPKLLGSGDEITIKTIGDLFQACDNLELQNVEI